MKFNKLNLKKILSRNNRLPNKYKIFVNFIPSAYLKKPKAFVFHTVLPHSIRIKIAHKIKVLFEKIVTMKKQTKPVHKTKS